MYFNPSEPLRLHGPALIKRTSSRGASSGTTSSRTRLILSGPAQPRGREAGAQKVDRGEARRRASRRSRDIEFRRAQQRAELARDGPSGRPKPGERPDHGPRGRSRRHRIANERAIAEARIASEREVRSPRRNRAHPGHREDEIARARGDRRTAAYPSRSAASPRRAFANEQETQAQADRPPEGDRRGRDRGPRRRPRPRPHRGQERRARRGAASTRTANTPGHVRFERQKGDAPGGENRGQRGPTRSGAHGAGPAPKQTRIKKGRGGFPPSREIQRQRTLDRGPRSVRARPVERPAHSCRPRRSAEAAHRRGSGASASWRSSVSRRWKAAEIRGLRAIDAARIAREKQIAATRIAADEDTKSSRDRPQPRRRRGSRVAAVRGGRSRPGSRRSAPSTPSASPPSRRFRVPRDRARPGHRSRRDRPAETVEKMRVATEAGAGAGPDREPATEGRRHRAPKRTVEEPSKARVVALAGPPRTNRAAAEADVQAGRDRRATRRSRPLEVRAREPRSRAARLGAGGGRLEQPRDRRVQALARGRDREPPTTWSAPRIASERGPSTRSAIRLRDRAPAPGVRARETVETAQMEKGHRPLISEVAAGERGPAPRRIWRAPQAARPRRASGPCAETEAANRRKSVDVALAEKTAAGGQPSRRGGKLPPRRRGRKAQRLINEAENVLTDPARASLFRRKLASEHVEGIVGGRASSRWRRSRIHPHPCSSTA